MFHVIIGPLWSITAVYLLTTIQTSKAVNHPAYFYFSDDRHIMRRVYISESIDKDVIEEANLEDSNVYCLYTRHNPDSEEILKHNENKHRLLKSKLNVTKITVFIIHGWTGNRNSDSNTILTKAFLQNADVNVLVVDWWKIARESYLTAVAALPVVGRHVGEFIKKLAAFGVPYNNMHVVGHSLGAHVAGNAGRATGGKIKRITGLDPAGPLWEDSPFQLKKADAQYVEIIHTNTACLGFNGLCGDADFFPNGGAYMPNCFFSTCSHSKAYYYMAESLKNNDLQAVPCSSVNDLYTDNCAGDPYLMGNNDLTKNRSGIFRLDTKDELEDMLLEEVPKSTPLKIATRRFLNISDILEYSCF